MSKLKTNVLLVSGNQYDVDNYLDSIKKNLKCDQVCKIYSDSSESSDIISEIMSSDIFSDKTLYLVKDLPDKDYNNIISVFNKIPSENYVIFYTYGSFKKYKKFTQGLVSINGKSCIKEFPEKVKSMTSLARDIIESNKKKISDSALNTLCSMMGGNSALLNNEIKKLLIYVDSSRNITEEDIEDICWRDDEFVIWDLLNALSAKNMPYALKILSKAFRSDVECEAMLYMLSRSLRLSIAIADCKKRKLSEKDMINEIKKLKKKEGAVIYNDYEIKKNISNRKSFCNNFTLDQLFKAFYSVNQSFLKVRAVYEPDEKEREMSLLLYAVCYPDNVIRVFDREVSYVR
jgi:DNA polymerase-3 subunit delta